MHKCTFAGVKSPFHTLEVAKWTKMGRKYMCVVEKLTTALFCITYDWTTDINNA